MRPRALLALLGATAGLCLASMAPAAGDSILDRRYTFDKLDAFWRTTLAEPPPEASRFALLGNPALAPASDVAVPSSFIPDVPFNGVVVGEDQSPEPSGEEARKGFPVIAIPGADAPVLFKRQALLELYLTRSELFERGQADGAERLDALRRRQASAAAELTLIGLMLYFSEPTLPGKCARLQRLVRLEGALPSGAPEDALEPGWRPLASILAQARARLDADKLADGVCELAPVRSRGEMRRIVTTRVRERLMREVDVKVQDALSLLQKASEEFQALVEAMNVEIRSADILELERVLGNVESNLLLVKTDGLKAASTIAEIQAVDLSQLDRPTELAEYSKAEGELAAMTAEIDRVLEATATLASSSEDPGIRRELAPCERLGAVYDDLDLTRDTASLEADVMLPLTSCLSAAEAIVRRFGAPSLDTTLAAALSSHVRQLSEAFLSSGN
ncbi:MAG TPA: hypothetical protein VGN97_00605 [Mesorhizobium sp.]|jgi:hypothetical protein|nr:hypothetical protein [Mesorhizobium sp.]